MSEASRSAETTKDFLTTSINAVARDLSYNLDCIRVSIVERSNKANGKTDVTLVLNTPEKIKAEELSEKLPLNSLIILHVIFYLMFV